MFNTHKSLGILLKNFVFKIQKVDCLKTIDFLLLSSVFRHKFSLQLKLTSNVPTFALLPPAALVMPKLLTGWANPRWSVIEPRENPFLIAGLPVSISWVGIRLVPPLSASATEHWVNWRSVCADNIVVGVRISGGKSYFDTRVIANQIVLYELAPDKRNGLVFGITNTIKNGWKSACRDAGIEGLQFRKCWNIMAYG